MRSLRSPCHRRSVLALFFASVWWVASSATVLAHAFTPSITLTAELWQNVHGGLATGAWWNTLADISAEFQGATIGAPASSAVVAISAPHFGPDFRALNGTATTEVTVEIAYQARLAKHLVTQADVQLLAAPARNARTQRRETACVVGVRTTMTF